ncbi:hypothetical protein ACIB24_16635 [Spongisporangium articulatum]|uniref:Uncharacterized protein n=1 Tax=Spongisporangium articulatum TaxID=3362603 RepID=A0ABW8ARW9_9ACTN
MSTPTQPMLSTEIRAEIADFVAAVEHELDDLPRDDVAELTGGLEADLIEAWAAEGTTPTQRFGSPQAYAAELRSAAGLSERGRRAPRFDPNLRRMSAHLRDAVRSMPGGEAILRTADDLQPAWWVVRALLLLVFPSLVLGFSTLTPVPFLALLLGGAFLAVWSLRWRGAGQAVAPVRGILLAWNVAALVGVLLLPSAVSSYYLMQNLQSDVYTDGEGATGLYLDGAPVSNVFAYDEDGKPLMRVRLYDQAGHPLTIDPALSYQPDGGDTSYLMAPDMIGPKVFNVFPMLLRVDSYDPGIVNPEQAAPLPFPNVGPLPEGVKLTAPAISATPQPEQTEDGQ